jgi:hypothetical protein
MGQKPAALNPEQGVNGTLNRGVESYIAKVVTGTAGVITVASSDTVAQCRMSFAKTATKTGRYTFTLPDKYRRFCGGNVTLIGPDDATWGANTTGLDYFFRDNDIDGGANDGTIELQFIRTDSNADAELPDNVIFIVELRVARGL